MFKVRHAQTSLCACMLVAIAAGAALLVGDVAEAQQAKAPGQQSQPERPHNMSGCLQKTQDGKSFMLTRDDRKTVEFSTSSVDLTPHVGRQIQITGTTDTEREAKEGGQQNGHYMQVTAVSVIAATCS